MTKQLCYQKLQLKNIRNLLVQTFNLAIFKAVDVKKHTRENTMPVRWGHVS